LARKYNPEPKQAVALVNFLRDKNIKTGAELGIFWGETFFYLLDNLPNLFLVGVDLWSPIDWGNEADEGFRSYEQFPLEKYFNDVCSKVKKYPNTKILRMDTVEASKEFPDNYFDFVFIDGDHTYEGVKRDIEAWKPKVYLNGWIVGHDIQMKGVKKAVKKTLKKYNELDNFVWYSQNRY